MDLDPLSFFAEEAEKDRVKEKERGEVAVISSEEEELRRELEVKEDWIDKKKQKMKKKKSTSPPSSSGFLNGDSSPERNGTVSSVGRERKTNSASASSTQHDEQDIPSLETYINILTGENTIIKLPDVVVQLYQSRIVPGTLFMTTYRIAFFPSPKHLASLGSSNPSIYSMFNIPLACVDKIEREKKQTKHQAIIITCKDVRQHRILFKGKVDPKTSEVIFSDSEIERAFSVMYRYAFPNNIRHVFAFTSKMPSALKDSPFRVEAFNMEKEFSRQGVFRKDSLGRSSPWRLSSENTNFKLCSTYPKLLAVPSSMDDVQLHTVAGFRSGHRFPVLSYLHSNNGATIWRSSQPKAGVSGSNSVDEMYLDLIARSCGTRISPTGEVHQTTKPLLFIIDCRPKSSALANRAAGAGYEVSNNYPNTKIEFLNIGNIHIMRDSYKSLSSVLTNSNSSNDTSFGKAIEETNWLTHVRLVLKASWDCAMSIVKGVPVLVHCSHGWDRTSQVVALAQLMLDPYFRTFEGFADLVEKDFISFGHPFQWRCGHGFDSQTRPDNEISPIFLQFLDCTYQLVSQYPQHFEFSTKYLLVILDHVYSCRFGTFLGNSDQEREQMGRDDLMSLWSFLNYNKSILANHHYMSPYSEDTPTTHILLPSLSKILRNVKMWKEFYFRWSSVASLIDPPQQVVGHMHENGVMKTWTADPENGLSSRHPDFDIPSISSCEDSWEGLYLAERKRREALEKRLAELGDTSSGPTGENTSPPSSAAQDEGQHGLKENIEALESLDVTNSILDGRDDFGLFDGASSSRMFEEDSDRLDLMALASMKEEEKEITDDEAERSVDETETEAENDQPNVEVKEFSVDEAETEAKNEQTQVEEQVGVNP